MSEGPEGLLEGPEGLSEGSEAFQRGLRACQRVLKACQRGLKACQRGLRAYQRGLRACQESLRAYQRAWGMDVWTYGRRDRISPLSTGFVPLSGPLPKNHFYELCSRITSKQIKTDACGWSHIAANSIFFSKNTYF